MTNRFGLIAALLAGALLVSGCAPLLGAGAAIVVDEAAEQQGGNLF